MSKTIQIVIRADARKMMLGLYRAELRLTRSRWRRLRLRWHIWRLERSLRR